MLRHWRGKSQDLPELSAGRKNMSCLPDMTLHSLNQYYWNSCNAWGEYVCSFILPDGGKGNNNSSLSCGCVNKGSQCASYIPLKAAAKAKRFTITTYKGRLGLWVSENLKIHSAVISTNHNNHYECWFNNGTVIRMCALQAWLPLQISWERCSQGDEDLSVHCDEENNSLLINGPGLEHSTGTP